MRIDLFGRNRDIRKRRPPRDDGRIAREPFSNFDIAIATFEPGHEVVGEGDEVENDFFVAQRLFRTVKFTRDGRRQVFAFYVPGDIRGLEPDATRDLLHWLSAIVALPVAAYAGRPFFDSAVRAFRQRALNMDAPISLGVVLALVLSVAQTLQHTRETYFDSAVMLRLFLLAGRFLDRRMRRKTRDFAGNLAAIKAERAVKLFDGGGAREVGIAAICRRRRTGENRRRRSGPRLRRSRGGASISRGYSRRERIQGI